MLIHYKRINYYIVMNKPVHREFQCCIFFKLLMHETLLVFTEVYIAVSRLGPSGDHMYKKAYQQSPTRTSRKSYLKKHIICSMLSKKLVIFN